jgi:hypothetical protein
MIPISYSRVECLVIAKALCLVGGLTFRVMGGCVFVLALQDFRQCMLVGFRIWYSVVMSVFHSRDPLQCMRRFRAQSAHSIYVSLCSMQYCCKPGERCKST